MKHLYLTLYSVLWNINAYSFLLRKLTYTHKVFIIKMFQVSYLNKIYTKSYFFLNTDFYSGFGRQSDIFVIYHIRYFAIGYSLTNTIVALWG